MEINTCKLLPTFTLFTMLLLGTFCNAQNVSEKKISTNWRKNDSLAQHYKKQKAKAGADTTKTRKVPQQSSWSLSRKGDTTKRTKTSQKLKANKNRIH